MRTLLSQAAYWKNLAEDHGDCLRDFVREPAIRDELVYQQAAIAGHFAHLYLGWLDEQTQEIVK